MYKTILTFVRLTLFSMGSLTLIKHQYNKLMVSSLIELSTLVEQSQKSCNFCNKIRNAGMHEIVSRKRSIHNTLFLAMYALGNGLSNESYL